MKFTVNVDCTPEEARQFMGLPNVAPMQDAIMAQVQEQMQKNLTAMDPEGMMKFWMPQGGAQSMGGGMQAFSDMQKMIWDQMSAMMPQDDSSAHEGVSSRSKARAKAR